MNAFIIVTLLATSASAPPPTSKAACVLSGPVEYTVNVPATGGPRIPLFVRAAKAQLPVVGKRVRLRLLDPIAFDVALKRRQVVGAQPSQGAHPADPGALSVGYPCGVQMVQRLLGRQPGPNVQSLTYRDLKSL